MEEKTFIDTCEIKHIYNSPDAVQSQTMVLTPEKTTDNPTVARLYSQLGHYPAPEHGVKNLNNKGIEKLFEGVDEYQKKNKDKPRDFYRKQFTQYMVKIAESGEKKYDKQAKKRNEDPESQAISAKNLLEKKGLELYQKALKEEMYSPEYRAAIFNKSTKFIEGKKWEKTPFIIIAGPSGCGKSFATDRVIQEINKLPKKIEGDDSGNLITCVDGSICREVSQMRKLAIRVANENGYPGIKDLHEESSILDEAKTCVKAAAIEDKNFAVVIPETYSTWSVPFSDHKDFMENISKSERQFIFTNVVGKNENTFQELVAYMGTKRAWKTDGFDKVPLDLNSIENLAESKAYGPTGFSHGKNGSDNASNTYEKIQVKHKKPILRLDIENDLILLCKKTDNPESWVAAKKGDKDILMVSEYTYNQWKELPMITMASVKLRDYNVVNPHSNVKASPHFENLLNIAKIQDGSGVDMINKVEPLLKSEHSVHQKIELDNDSLQNTKLSIDFKTSQNAHQALEGNNLINESYLKEDFDKYKNKSQEIMETYLKSEQVEREEVPTTTEQRR